MPAPGEALLIKLWETIADKGIGSLLRPWQIRREGRANVDNKRSELLVLAQTERDVAAIRRGEMHGGVNGILADTPQLLPAPPVDAALELVPLSLPNYEDVARRNAAADSVQREVRLAKAIIYAEEELAQDGAMPSATPVSDDWLYRWRDCAASVSSEDLQSVWGKVLAGEVKAPGRFSLRTLEFVRNLSQSEAAVIERLSPFVIENMVHRVADTALGAAGIDFGTLLSLQELGVLAGVDGLGLEISWKSIDPSSFVQALKSHGRVLVIKAPDQTKVLKLPARALTAIGRQVLQLGTFQPNESYLREVGEAIKTQGFSVEIGTYLLAGESGIRVFGAEQL